MEFANQSESITKALMDLYGIGLEMHSHTMTYRLNRGTL